MTYRPIDFDFMHPRYGRTGVTGERGREELCDGNARVGA
jgi:hypothetical protein